MSYFKRKGDKARFDFVDAFCIGRKCWAPGMFQHRSPMSCGGSRNTGSPDSPCCLNRAYRGCPEGPIGESTYPCDCPGNPHGTHHLIGLPEYYSPLIKQRKAEGWRNAK